MPHKHTFHYTVIGLLTAEAKEEKKKDADKKEKDVGDGQGSEASSTTSSTQRAKLIALKRAVQDAESFLGSEEGQSRVSNLFFPS